MALTLPIRRPLRRTETAALPHESKSPRSALDSIYARLDEDLDEL